MLMLNVPAHEVHRLEDLLEKAEAKLKKARDEIAGLRAISRDVVGQWARNAPLDKRVNIYGWVADTYRSHNIDLDNGVIE